MHRSSLVCFLLVVSAFSVSGQETQHDHPPPEELGSVSFPVTCASAVQTDFNRAIALLHSFAYSSAEAAFKQITVRDPQCAMAYWGIAMTHFHQLWEPPLPAASLAIGSAAITQARQMSSRLASERTYIEALATIYEDPSIPYSARVVDYQKRVCTLARTEPGNTEAQVFCGLALLASASPLDRSHSNQKHSADMLEPLYKRFPNHPGIVHYLIHAYDNTELANRGLQPAREYSKIAPSAPHALHMPSHIFTRLGLWQDSISSNLAARRAARDQGDLGEELHAMDYLVHAYLQLGWDQSAVDIIAQTRAMPNLGSPDFKIAYAATAMQVRYFIEREQWHQAINIIDPIGAPPHVTAIATWARALGYARTKRIEEARREVRRLQALERQLRNTGMTYWADQVAILEQEALAWWAEEAQRHVEAVTLLTHAADAEDSMEKLPVTPGPIVPAREQLGYLLLRQNNQSAAASEFRVALGSAPNRLGAVRGLRLASGSSAR
jgi:tetratricopeptide (TPR) repeat protein